MNVGCLGTMRVKMDWLRTVSRCVLSLMLDGKGEKRQKRNFLFCFCGKERVDIVVLPDDGQNLRVEVYRSERTRDFYLQDAVIFVVAQTDCTVL